MNGIVNGWRKGGGKKWKFFAFKKMASKKGEKRDLPFDSRGKKRRRERRWEGELVGKESLESV